MESKVVGYDRLLDIARERQQKLKDEQAILKKLLETANWELEAQVAQKENLLAEREKIHSIFIHTRQNIYQYIIYSDLIHTW